MLRSVFKILTPNIRALAINESRKLMHTSAKVLSNNRTLSTHNHTHALSEAAINKAAVSKNDIRNFMSVWPDIVRDLNDYAKKYDKIYGPKWLSKLLQYNVPNGKKYRGLILVEAFKILAKDGQMTDENLKLAQTLGWCIEMLQAVFIIDDDIIDGSTTRRGHKCWYQLEDVGLAAINDAMMIENGIYYLLKKYFRQAEYYQEVVDLFHEVSFITSLGQLQDIKTAHTLDLNFFTMEMYKSIVANKTAYYSFYLPVALAMHMTGYKDPEVFRQTKTILLEIGNFFQVQDDFIDCFGDPSITGKVGTDIQDGKCTWLSVVALQRANEDQRLLMKDCYGQKDPEKVERVKELYEDLLLPHTYEIYEEESYKIINTHIQQISRGLPHKLFFKILEKIYRRNS
ncbi:hypothetical protein PVAND_005789 [Polypedilum vanderplanki]|uniref:Farnesyl pyrophosphate synthase n=1 Tax=Polypedilum vanderplanki TaxID=319348 RepID=A0A9J6C183_POLVA|nr:hypothetical protein PVAND_005789 [Polypedilum vanderplanki]